MIASAGLRKVRCVGPPWFLSKHFFSNSQVQHIAG